MLSLPLLLAIAIFAIDLVEVDFVSGFWKQDRAAQLAPAPSVPTVTPNDAPPDSFHKQEPQVADADSPTDFSSYSRNEAWSSSTYSPERLSPPLPVPLPRPRPDMWEENYIVWVPKLEREYGDNDNGLWKREWRSCRVENAPPICSAPIEYRKDPDHWPYDAGSLVGH
jgi:hypothetical protein